MQNQTFKAAALFKQKNKLKIIDLEFPKKLHRGQVFVKIIRFAICGAQINEINGVKGEDKYLPHLMGHEGGGTVLKIGEGVNHVKVNDNVVMHWRPGFGIDSNFPSPCIKVTWPPLFSILAKSGRYFLTCDKPK